MVDAVTRDMDTGEADRFCKKLDILFHCRISDSVRGQCIAADGSQVERVGAAFFLYVFLRE